jgi:hypothetical protein
MLKIFSNEIPKKINTVEKNEFKLLIKKITKK